MPVKEYNGDAEALRPLAEAWEKECNGEKFKINLDIEVFLRGLQGLIGGEQSTLLVLYRDEPVGLMGVRVFNSPIGNQRIANEHLYFVLPEERGLSSIRLIRAAEQWAREKNCSHLILNASTLASDLHDKVCRLYGRMGLAKFETSYIRNL